MSQKTHGHTRIARESRIATTVRFLLAQRATKSDTSGLCLLPGLMRVGSKDGPGSVPAVAKTNDEEQGLAEQARARAVHDRERLLKQVTVPETLRPTLLVTSTAHRAQRLRCSSLEYRVLVRSLSGGPFCDDRKSQYQRLT